MKLNFKILVRAALISTSLCAPAAFGQTVDDDSSVQTVALSVDTQEFSKGRGSFRSATLEYKFELDDTTVLLSPTIGERKAGALRATSLGLGATVYHDWSDKVSTRSHIFVSESDPVFAEIDAAQDISFHIAPKTTMTAGLRWARYAGGRDVSFASLGARYYFHGGSVAYRATRTKASGQGAFLAHMVNLNVNDPHGGGKTQLWLSTGAASLTRAQFDQGFSGDDHAATVQRTQPLSEDFSLIATAGISSYALPVGRYTGANFGLGLAFKLD